MRYQLVFAYCLLSSFAFGQGESSAFTLTGKGVAGPFATDYQSLGINPANLHFNPAYEGKNWAMGFGETGVSIFSEALTKEELRKNLYFQDLDELSQQERQDAISQFTLARWTADMDMMHFGLAFRADAFGGIGISVRERVDLDMKLGPFAADLMFNGYASNYFDNLILETGDTIANTGNLSADTLALITGGFLDEDKAQTISDLIEGTDIEFNWVREFNVGYGRSFVNTEDLALYGGIGLKYLQGLANISIRAQDGVVSGFSATTPWLNIDYGEAEATNPSALKEDGMKPVGKGFGIDLGFSAVVQEKFTISAAVNDIGSMTWDGNVYTLRDTVLVETQEPGVETVSLVDQLSAFMENEDVLEWGGDTKYESKLPANFRIGAAWKLGDRIRIGAEIIAPLNDEAANIDRAVYSVGGDFKPFKWLSLNFGYIAGGNYDIKIPAGVTAHIGNGAYEVGVASRDMVTFFTDNQPTASVAFGFMRFRW